MKEKFMIVKIQNVKNYIENDKLTIICSIVEPCYIIQNKDYDTLELAYIDKQNLSNNEDYIITNYWV